MQAEKMSWINLMKGKENTVRVTEIPFLATDIETRKINQTQTVIAPTMNVNRVQELPFRDGVGFNIRVPPLIILSLDSADAVGAVIVTRSLPVRETGSRVIDIIVIVTIIIAIVIIVKEVLPHQKAKHRNRENMS